MGTRSSSGVCAEACDAVHQLGDPPLEFCVVAAAAIDVVHIVHPVYRKQILMIAEISGAPAVTVSSTIFWTFLKAALAILPGGSDCGRRRGHPARAHGAPDRRDGLLHHRLPVVHELRHRLHWPSKNSRRRPCVRHVPVRKPLAATRPSGGGKAGGVPHGSCLRDTSSAAAFSPSLRVVAARASARCRSTAR